MNYNKLWIAAQPLTDISLYTCLFECHLLYYISDFYFSHSKHFPWGTLLDSAFSVSLLSVPLPESVFEQAIPHTPQHTPTPSPMQSPTQTPADSPRHSPRHSPNVSGAADSTRKTIVSPASKQMFRAKKGLSVQFSDWGSSFFLLWMWVWLA